MLKKGTIPNDVESEGSTEVETPLIDKRNPVQQNGQLQQMQSPSGSPRNKCRTQDWSAASIPGDRDETTRKRKNT